MKLYGTVLLTGSAEGLDALRAEQLDEFVTEPYRRNAMFVFDVTEPELRALRVCGRAHNVEVAEARDVAEIEIVPLRTAAKLDLMQGSWYRTNQDAFPLLMVRRVRHRAETDEYIFDVDLFNAGNLADPATMSAETLQGYGLKPAAIKDFEDLDIVPPVSFVPDPHAIPEAQTGMEAGAEEAQEKDEELIGVSLATAHVASIRAKEQLGIFCARAEPDRLAPGRYGIQVQLRSASYRQEFPATIEGVPVRYRDA